MKPSLAEIKCQNPKKKIYRPKKSAPITCQTAATAAPTVAGSPVTSLGRCGDMMDPNNKKVNFKNLKKRFVYKCKKIFRSSTKSTRPFRSHAALRAVNYPVSTQLPFLTDRHKNGLTRL